MMLVEKFKESVYTCFRCGHCRDSISAGYKVCPVRENTSGFELYTAKGKIMLIRAVIENRIPLSSELAEAFYTCTLCGNCRDKCYSNKFIDTVELFKAFRADLYQSGFVEPELKALMNSVREYGNPFSESAPPKREEFPTSSSKQSHEIVYFPGCTTWYKRPEIGRSVCDVLTAAGSDFMVTSDELCCGYPALVIGDRELFQKIGQKNIESLEGIGAKAVVFSCAAGYRTFKLDYPRLVREPNFEVLHVLELIHRYISEKKLSLNNKVEMIATYHDPCHIGRHLASLKSEMYEEPRDILAKVLSTPLIEMPRNKRNAWCCGAGGMMNLTSKEVASSIASDRTKEAVDTGANTIVTSCTQCKESLLEAATMARLPLRVYDIAEVVAMGIC
jgi:heterodisulfide reductase subunit D